MHLICNNHGDSCKICNQSYQKSKIDNKGIQRCRLILFGRKSLIEEILIRKVRSKGSIGHSQETLFVFIKVI